MLRWWRHALVTCALSLFPACVRYQPPRDYPAPDALSVNASFDRTWGAVIDRFALGNIPIKTIERASGIIVAEPLSVASASSKKYADCGTQGILNPPAQRASYSVRVTGDSLRSAIRVAASFGSPLDVYCRSKGVFETEFMTAIKAAAEKRSP